jgi:hypothetical protein
MIKKTKEGFMIRCDTCGNEEEVDTHGDLEVFKEMMHEAGWKTLHGYKNRCEDCDYERGEAK